MDGNSNGAIAGNELVENPERDGHIPTAAGPVQGNGGSGVVSLLVHNNGTFIDVEGRGGFESSYCPSQQLEDLGTIGALLNHMKTRIQTSYSLGQVGSLLSDPPPTNNEATADTQAIRIIEPSQESRQAKVDFRQAAEHILLELKKINDELEYEIEVSTVVDPQALEKVLSQLSQKAAYICVGGRYNSGKSTLINALLRSSILPCSRDAETAVTVYVTGQAPVADGEIASDVPRLCFRLADGQEAELCSGEQAICERLREENCQQRLDSLSLDREFVVRTTVPIFSECRGVEGGLTPYLIDLPGSNEVCQKKLADVAKVNMDTATAFLYIMTYSELRNSQDFDALKAIYDRDRKVFIDGRMRIVVTQYDKFYEGSRNHELSMESVQEKVAEMIMKALKLSMPVSRELIIPVSGQWGYWARACHSTEGGLHRNDVTVSLFSLMRDEGQEKMFEVMNLSPEDSCSMLEKASRIVVLEEQMKDMLHSMIGVWKRSIAVNSEKFIHQATMELDKMYRKSSRQLKEIDDVLKKATDLYNLHQRILCTVQKESEVLEELRKCYVEDAKSGDKLRILIGELTNTFVVQVKSKKKEENYYQGQLVEDVQGDFRILAEKELHKFFQQMKYNKCASTLQRAINRMADRCGRLRSAGVRFRNQEKEDLTTLPEEHGLEATLDDTIEKKDEKALGEFYVPPMHMSLGMRIKAFLSMILPGLFKFTFVKDEELADLERHIRSDLQEFCCTHFEEIEEHVILYFFKIYCQKVVHNLDTFHRQMTGLDVVALINEHKERKAILSKKVADLQHWKDQTLSELSTSLKSLGS